MSTSSGPDNFLVLEQAIADRLTEQLADMTPVVKVLTSKDLAGVTEDQQITPAVHVIYKGYRMVEGRTDGNTARVEQTWLAVVATRNAKTQRTGTAARADAGLIARRVLSALMAFKPDGCSKPLRLTDAPDGGGTSGFAYLPLGFTAELVFTN